MSVKDYTHRTIYVIMATVCLLIVLMFIPGFSMGEITIKRANIATGIVHFNDEMDASFKLKPEATDQTSAVDIPEQLREDIEEKKNSVAIKPRALTPMDTSYLHIEDYSCDSMMYKFYKTLATHSSDSLIRIGICGDSYIEADIITSDLRELLQQDYGGEGIGFINFSHPLLRYRSTIATTSYGWTNYSVMKRKNIPDSLKQSMYISGNISIPEEDNARCYFKGKNSKKYISNCSNANIYFSTNCNNKLYVTINDTTELQYDIFKKNEVQCISIHDNINSLSVSVNKKDGFVGYGISFNGDNGVVVDNYSIRGNSGINLFYTQKEVNKQMNSFLEYDMIILQYGLNVMSDDIINYSNYKAKLEELIAFIKLCFPKCAIVVMGVSDRAKKDNGTLRSMRGIPYLINAQRAAAMETGVAFWNTFKAMGGDKSIIDFVNKGWAGNDYTHINYKGGKYIAEQLTACMTKECEIVKTQEILKSLKPVQINLPDRVETENEKVFRIICSLDKSKHRITSSKHDRKMRKW